MSVGNVTSVPPPATAFIMPATHPAIMNAAIWIRSGMSRFGVRSSPERKDSGVRHRFLFQKSNIVVYRCTRIKTRRREWEGDEKHA